MKLKITCYKKMCESCDECDGIVCNEPTGVSIGLCKIGNGANISIVSQRTKIGCSVRTTERFKREKVMR